MTAAAPGPAGAEQSESVVCDYAAHLSTVSARVNPAEPTAARQLCSRFGGPSGFATAALAEQLEVPRPALRFIDWLIATGRLNPGADYLLARRVQAGQLLARTHPDLHRRFLAAAGELGFAGQMPQRQWTALAYLAFIAGHGPHQFDLDRLQDAADQLLAAAGRYWAPATSHQLHAAMFGLEATLFHLGLLERLSTTKRRRRRAQSRDQKWAHLPTGLTATMHHYLDQMAISLRPATVNRYEVWLRQFAGFLASQNPPVTTVAGVTRAHIEAFKTHLTDRAAQHSDRLARGSVRDALVVLRCVFERLTEWQHPDAPARVPIFGGDIPTKDRPLPRFLDDAAAAKLLRAARTHPDPLVRVIVEVLARTGLRRSELAALTTDAIVRIGSAWWLKIPVGKLHTDRYIPLHPTVKELLDQWLGHRPAARSNLLFLEYGRPLSAQRVNEAVAAAATAAGLDHVTPHQLRHTLATQAINRGMSLEAIAALLGHTSMTMTLTYARIADRTVADEYFDVTSKVEALYDGQPATLPADAEGHKMRKLRREMHERLLGNGYCTRPPELDCRFESICESCTFFATTIEFRPTLQRQRDDAAAKHQHDRQQLFDRLLTELDNQTAS
ncbi:MAG TPA: tyrosine-type recombinase/integrase [Pseudonocardiaceae bacterium]